MGTAAPHHEQPMVQALNMVNSNFTIRNSTPLLPIISTGILLANTELFILLI